MAKSATGQSDKLSKLSLNDFKFHMVFDKKTEMYVKFAKVMVICQGPHSDKRKNTFTDVERVFKSASRALSDKTYVTETKSVCTAEATDDFYTYLREEVKTGLESGHNLIYIDSTMSNLKQNKYYCSLANKMQYVVLIIPPIVTERKMEHQWQKGSQADSFRQLKTRIETPNMFRHLFCGWFLHDIDTDALRNECMLYANDLLEEIPDFGEWFAKVGAGKDFAKFFSLRQDEDVKKEELVLREDIAFCPVKLFSSDFYMSEYFQKAQVQEHYGKMSKLYIVGFIISPHMVAARVKLTHKQKELWEIEDRIKEDSSISLCATELYNQSKADLPPPDVKRICSKSNATLIRGEYLYEPINQIPPTAKGRSCHIVLGTSPGAPYRNIDYDVAFALNRDFQAFKDDIKIEVQDIGKSQVKKIGKYWFIYLKDTLIVNGLFASCCKPHVFDMPLESLRN